MKPMLEFLQTHLPPGHSLTIEFKAKAEDLESYPEAGMRARLTGYAAGTDGVVELRMDYQPFDAHNAALEKANYYDRDGHATLTARQANHYKPQETLYVMDTDPAEQYFSVLTPGNDLREEGHAPADIEAKKAALKQRIARVQAELETLKAQVHALDTVSGDGPPPQRPRLKR